MIKTAKLYGNDITLSHTETALPEGLNDKFRLKRSIEVAATRSENKPIIIEFEDDDLLAIHFTDNTEWIGHPEDIQELYGKSVLENRSGKQEDYLFETQITADNQTRGFVSRAVVKLFSVFSTKAVAKVSMTQLGKSYDQKVQPHPGLYQLNADFKLEPFKKTAKTHYLLFLHGTLSTTIDAFSGLKSTGVWQEMQLLYGSNIIALEHYTLSQSPLQNALDFLLACPDDCTLDILSHSRGGLVADILAKCDHRNFDTQVGFSENELSIVYKEDKVSHKLMLSINELVISKRIKIVKIVRVAAPASGTTILSRRVDHFFNLLLNAISLAFGIRNPMYEYVKSFLLELINQKEDPEVLPGLNSMMPESVFQNMMNAADTAVVSDLFAITGDADASGINLDSLKVILANLFYQAANDLVVDTRRMLHGVQRRDGIYAFPSKGSETNHFKYFSNSNTQNAILEALLASENKPALSYTKMVHSAADRGVVLDLFSMDGFSLKPKNITRDVVIIVPGIMGSTLATNNEDRWVSFSNLNKGTIASDLNISATNVEASGIIKKYYAKMGAHFEANHDVITLEFDWRKSVKSAAVALKELLDSLSQLSIGVNIVAHSMGGLVVRQCMMSHKPTWELFSKNKNNKFIMLGTPWLGSYLIMEVLTGHSKRVKQLAAIDFKNSKKDLLKIFWKYPGVFELMPIEMHSKRAFWETQFWDELNEKAKLEVMPPAEKNTRALKDFEDFRTEVISFLDHLDKEDNDGFFKNIFYICGKANETVFDYTFKSRFLSKNEKLVYKATSYGDGSVTWQSGIPKQLKGSKNLYYANTSHGDLANETYIFEGIADIITSGSTLKLSANSPASRSGEIISEVHEYAEPLGNKTAVLDAIFNVEQPTEPVAELITVTVVNGDLKVASYPVLVGHFYMDMILSAEKALDGYLNNRLSQRLDIGYYPGRVGESEVFFNLKTQPKGAIVCGMGDSDKLTTFLVAKTVKMATLKYAMFMRDNYTLPEAKRYANGISVILIGIGYGKLPIEDSIKGILLGVSAANTYIKEKGEGLKLIKDIEVINYYESIASQAYFSLNRIKDNDNRILINLKKGILRRTGAKKKQLFGDSQYNWWYNLHINSIVKQAETTTEPNKVVGFNYYATNGTARVEQEMIGIGLDRINLLLEDKAYQFIWNKRLSKTLFEMLIPNDFKDIFRNQTNMIIKMDRQSAQLPWELLHDPETDETPASVSSSFIRQLVAESPDDFDKVALSNNNAFVVGDPLYENENLPQLPAAKAEAEWLNGQLTRFGFTSNVLLNSTATTIMMELFNKDYKIMHFSGHGLYAPEKGEVGIAIGNGICIDPAMIKQLGYVPEFVFINCCYSGAVNAADDNYSKQRYKLAANVGTQLIEMGVKAIVISGWAVDDAAAKTFAEAFYNKMFEGYNFGMAVQKARMACYQLHKSTNTWGAYQCYGNQFYQFDSRMKTKKEDLEYVISSQVYTDLDNLLIAIRDQKYNTVATLTKLEFYLEKVQNANLLDASVLEKEAMIYNELGYSEIAYQKFKDLFQYTSGNFSIEALEQYCIIKTNRIQKETLLEDLHEIEFLTLIGKNPSRLNIVGNAYKIASKLLDTNKERIEYLKKAFTFYEDSYKASSDPYSGEALDAMSNLIFIGHILELLGDDKLLDRINKSNAFESIVDVKTYLQDFHQELESFDKTDLDVSVLIGMAEANYGLMLLDSKFKPSIEIEIIDRFKHVFRLLYSPRYIKYEIIQIEFLLFYIKDEVIKKQLEAIKLEVQQLLN
ncbi:CHAT domain-containing protein [Subsaximicrobium wynnwilliamsii]|uniref:CHAT domain-containing protein n=1 Tax=Subsaximicrobium wynnwilliamsii TaxID=291179 RepID=A0A5C6ZE42_9FLAO|nr:CHAT domain-containing protein [Subsaximicrobium wynnwilliamsii]TXD83284.1 CHAT domain-containing protein [Subsaximicrobium wynnwilliamsii]TXD87383.1 CHAT domain-containing protein [Subsaximicrobium wynnwilliamsii]TXE03307.1 CHAT domain-containing protein [Subsaximicrobium wynnwilliamsii]